MLSSACTISAEAVVVPGLCWEPGLEPAPGDGQNIAPGMERKGKAMPCSQRGPACKQGSISLSGPLLSSLKCYLLTGSLISYNEARIVASDFGLGKWKQILTPLQKDNDIPFFLPASFAAPSACSFSPWKLLLDMVAPDASLQPSGSTPGNVQHTVRGVLPRLLLYMCKETCRCFWGWLVRWVEFEFEEWELKI